MKAKSCLLCGEISRVYRKLQRCKGMVLCGDLKEEMRKTDLEIWEWSKIAFQAVWTTVLEIPVVENLS
jgi:hypothetical protein